MDRNPSFCGLTINYKERLLPVIKELKDTNCFKEAEFLTRRLLKYYAGSHTLWQLLGELLLEQQKEKEALFAYEKAIALRSNKTSYYPKAASLAVKCKIDLDKLQRITTKILKRIPGDPHLLFALAVLELAEGRVDLAEKHLVEVIGKDPHYIEGYILLSDVLKKKEDFGNSLNVVVQALILSFQLKDLSLLHVILEKLLKLKDSPNKEKFLKEALGHNIPLLLSEKQTAEILRAAEEIGADTVINDLLKTLIQTCSSKTAFSYLREKKRFKSNVGKARGRKPLVVLVCDTPRSREAKIGYALKKEGVEPILLYLNHPNFNPNPFFSEAIKCISPYQVLLELDLIQPNICHLFSLAGDELSKEVIEEKICPVVFDTNDIFDGAIDGCDDLIPLQRFCLENADALCCRDLQSNYVKKAVSYSLPSKRILFPDYCWNEREIIGEDYLRRDSSAEITVVHIGNFPIEKVTGERGLLKIAKELIKQQIHFHIYPHWFYYNNEEKFRDDFSEYLEIADTSPYLKVFMSVSMENVIPTIRKYDFAMCATPDVVLGFPPVRSFEHYFYGGSARITDYIDALLPTIITKNTYFQYRRLNQYGMAINGGDKFLYSARKVLSEFKKNINIGRFIKGRTEQGVCRHIKRLIAFYEEVYRFKRNSPKTKASRPLHSNVEIASSGEATMGSPRLLNEVLSKT